MIDQLSLLVRQLTISQRIGIAFGSLFSVILLVGLVMWAGRPDFQPAFTRLSTSDAAAISEALRSANVPFELADAGATILVPSAQLAAARVAAGAAGFTGDSVSGFELFDQQGFGQSEFDQEVTFQRALEGKLTQTILKMDGIAEATVSIVPAKSSVLASDDRPATASVNVRMRSGQAPDASMVQGIVSTVSGAVAGLTPENVTVVDANGRVLAGPTDSLAGDALAIRATVERSITAKVQALVDTALGAGVASIAVSADLDLSKVEKEVRTVTPITTDNWTPASVQVVDERYDTSGAAGVLGIPGAISNVPGLPSYPGLPVASAAPSAAPSASPGPSSSPGPSASPGASAAASAAPAYVKHQETVNYATSEEIARISEEPGTVKRLSVAVLLDQNALGQVTPESLQAAIEAAIGADATRGDVVNVSAVPFVEAAAAAEGELAGDDPIAMVTGIASSAVGVLVALVLLVLVWRNIGALRRRAEDMQLTATRPQYAELGAGAGGPGGAPALGAGRVAAGIPDLPAYDDSPQARISQQIRTVADDKPEEIVGLVTSWLNEDERKRR